MKKLGMLGNALIVCLWISASAFAQETIVAWGWNVYGQLDRPANLTNVLAIAAKGYHSVALTKQGRVAAWGNLVPMAPPPELKDVIAISCGDGHGLALISNRTVVAWGRNDYGQTNVPRGLSNVVEISAGFYHNLALTADGTVVAWGDPDRGIAVPAGLSDVVAISAGLDHNLALKRNGTVVAWGRNYGGLLDVPLGLTNVTAISAGQMHSLAILEDGSVAGWGSYYSVPMRIPAEATNIVAISAGSEHSLALRSDGKIIGWGSEWNPELGLALPPSGLPKATAIAAGSYHTLALIDGVFTNRPPVAICRDAIGYADDFCLAYELYVDGGSFDPDGHPIMVTSWPDLPYPPGTNKVMLTVTDYLGAWSSCIATVTVLDPTPTTFTNVAAIPSALTQRNHQMVSVRISASVLNACHYGSWRITEVQSSEPVTGRGYGNTHPDWVITGNDTVDLRGENYGREGRTYYVTVQAVNTLDQPVATYTIAVPVLRR